MEKRLKRWGLAGVSALSATILIGTQMTAATAGVPVKHVLLISVDGLHQSDVTQCIANHLCPTIAMLSAAGANYTNASTSEPSDSSPGVMAFFTGATPKLNGVYYDDSYDRTFYAPAAQTSSGTQDCSGPAGSEAPYFENLDTNAPSVANGQVGSRMIIGETVDPAQEPDAIVNGVCTPVAPNDYNRTNSVMSIAHAAGMYTAWADKHPGVNAEIAGKGTPNTVDDPFNTEINADIIPTTTVDTRGNTVTFPLPNPTGDPNGFFITDKVGNTEAYDQIKVDAILNQIDGWNSMGTAKTSVPNIFGMNFQTVSVGEKLVDPQLSCARSGNAPGCDPSYQPGGYEPGTLAFTPQLTGAVQWVDGALASMVNELKAKHLFSSTEIILTAKHGQSPIDPSKLQLIGHAEATVLSNAGIGVAQITDDDIALIWLADQSQTAAAVTALNNSISAGNPAHIQYVLSGAALQAKFGSPATDPRTPDIIVQPIPGTIYSHSSAKVAEHGGFSTDDTHVAMIVVNGANTGQNAQGDQGNHNVTVSTPVATDQVAPTILQSLGLNYHLLDGVRIQGTQVLPGLGSSGGGNSQ